MSGLFYFLQKKLESGTGVLVRNHRRVPATTEEIKTFLECRHVGLPGYVFDSNYLKSPLMSYECSYDDYARRIPLVETRECDELLSPISQEEMAYLLANVDENSCVCLHAEQIEDEDKCNNCLLCDNTHIDEVLLPYSIISDDRTIWRLFRIRTCIDTLYLWVETKVTNGPFVKVCGDRIFLLWRAYCNRYNSLPNIHLKVEDIRSSATGDTKMRMLALMTPKNIWLRRFVLHGHAPAVITKSRIALEDLAQLLAKPDTLVTELTGREEDGILFLVDAPSLCLQVGMECLVDNEGETLSPTNIEWPDVLTFKRGVLDELRAEMYAKKDDEDEELPF